MAAGQLNRPATVILCLLVFSSSQYFVLITEWAVVDYLSGIFSIFSPSTRVLMLPANMIPKTNAPIILHEREEKREFWARFEARMKALQQSQQFRPARPPTQSIESSSTIRTYTIG